MEKSDLSGIYYLATSRMAEAVNEVYERLHSDKGDPHTSLEMIYEITKIVKVNIDQECDLIRQALIEHHEQTESKQAKLF
jgi:hypothetical protein